MASWHAHKELLLGRVFYPLLCASREEFMGMSRRGTREKKRGSPISPLSSVPHSTYTVHCANCGGATGRKFANCFDSRSRMTCARRANSACQNGFARGGARAREGGAELENRRWRHKRQGGGDRREREKKKKSAVSKFKFRVPPSLRSPPPFAPGEVEIISPLLSCSSPCRAWWRHGKGGGGPVTFTLFSRRLSLLPLGPMQPFHRRRPALPYMHAPVASVPILNFRNGTNEKKVLQHPFPPLSRQSGSFAGVITNFLFFFSTAHYFAGGP